MLPAVPHRKYHSTTIFFQEEFPPFSHPAGCLQKSTLKLKESICTDAERPCDPVCFIASDWYEWNCMNDEGQSVFQCMNVLQTMTHIQIYFKSEKAVCASLYLHHKKHFLSRAMATELVHYSLIKLKKTKQR